MNRAERQKLTLPYYAVIFSYEPGPKPEGYAEMDEETIQLAQTMPGYLAHESRNDGQGTIFISYQKDLESIDNWSSNERHRVAMKGGKSGWYGWYHSQTCRVEKGHSFEFENKEA